VIQLGALSGVAVRAVQFEARAAWRFGSWDRARLPLPFARIECRYAEPLEVGSDADADADLAALQERLR
jgi:lysophospholipid acyltransferase (LPLAT)-like uncharacterized protein